MLADSFEYLVNRLLFDVLINENNLSGSYITFLQMELDKFITLSSMLSELPVIDIEILDGNTLIPSKKHKRKTPIPKAFLDAFKETED